MNLRFLVSCIFTVQIALLSINFIEAASIRKRREDDTVATASVSTTDEGNTEARIGINISPGGGITLPGTGTGQIINQNTVIKGPTAIYGGGGGGGKPKKPPGPAKCTNTKRCKNKVGKPRRPPRPVGQPQPHPGAGNHPVAVYNGLQDEGNEDESENAHDESVESSDAQDVSEDEDADASVEQDHDASEEQDQEQDAHEEQDANEEQDEDPPEAQPEADEDE